MVREPFRRTESTLLVISLESAEKRAGRVFTPEVVAEALCRWAVRSPADRVLDLGVGEGVFAIAAFRRLSALGANDLVAATLVHGAERDQAVFDRAQESCRRQLGCELPNVVCADFYSTPLPAVDAVVGNPPYIRRQHLGDPEKLGPIPQAAALNGLADAYCYFIMRACAALKPGGRLAVLVSASWLDMRYGVELKRLLIDQFRLRLLLGFDGRVFPNALVKPVVILAERTDGRGEVTFGRLRSAARLEHFQRTLEDLVEGRLSPDAIVTRVGAAELSPELQWSSFLKSSGVYDDLGSEIPLTPLRDVAGSRIGLQTFAKPFHILTRDDAARWGLEADYLLPLAFSPRDIKSPLIAEAGAVRHVVFACDRPEAALQGTAAGRYIALAMQTPVEVRGKDEMVEGFHRAPRLVRAGRRPWYNLRSAIEKRGSFPILLPRRVYQSYLVVHNRAGVVANEDFIELRPLDVEDWTAPFLAFLNSSMGEFLVRSHSFQYGGGVYNLNPGAVREIPVLDPAELSAAQRHRLLVAWEDVIHGWGTPGWRQRLDSDVVSILGISTPLSHRITAALEQMIGLAHSATRAH